MPMAVNWDARIAEAFAKLQAARAHGDKLVIELAEAALNDLLDRKAATLVTRNKETV